MPKNELFSIVICTHNRAELLCGAIESVVGQNFTRKDFELIIVDNASSDHTRDVVRKFCDAYSNIRYVMEANLGLSQARNRGMREARGEYVGYLDDDAKASPTWLSAACYVADRIHPEAFGGPYLPFYLASKPAWFKDEYGSHIQGSEPRMLMDNEYLDGGNMFVRRDVLEAFDGFHSGFGMKGKKVAYGEETHFFIRVRVARPETVLYYHPEVLIYHLVRPEKYNFWLRARELFVFGLCAQRIFSDGVPTSLRASMEQLAVICINITRGLTIEFLRRDTKQYPYYQNYLYEKLVPLFYYLGKCFENISQQFREK